MARPSTNTALKRLGKRLVEGAEPTPADLHELQALLAAYGPVLERTVQRVTEAIGSVPASRIKNTGTTLEKLRRSGGYSLSSIQDLAGLRIVIDGDRDEQDRVAALLTATFSDEERAPKLVDRRAQPVQGYRAVHVVVYPESFPIEIQVRTWAQHRWAEWFERLADQYGRGIRYGDPPTNDTETAQQAVQWMLQLADQIAETEESGATPPLSLMALELLDWVMSWLQTRNAGS